MKKKMKKEVKVKVLDAILEMKYSYIDATVYVMKRVK